MLIVLLVCAGFFFLVACVGASEDTGASGCAALLTIGFLIFAGIYMTTGRTSTVSYLDNTHYEVKKAYDRVVVMTKDETKTYTDALHYNMDPGKTQLQVTEVFDRDGNSLGKEIELVTK